MLPHWFAQHRPRPPHRPHGLGRRPRQQPPRSGEAPWTASRTEDISGLNIPTGIPLSYELDADFKPLKPGGTYLDPDAAKAAIEAVKNQGKKK
ncbi:hypothetical protein SMICM17S_04790 [Streptomyces microflavus]